MPNALRCGVDKKTYSSTSASYRRLPTYPDLR